MFDEKIDEMNRETDMMPAYPETGKRTYTVSEIQDILNISLPTTYELIKQGVFHSIRVGRHIRISKISFDKWLDQGE